MISQTQLDEQFYKEIPKVELHRHLEGSVRTSTFIDFANAIPIPHNPSVNIIDTVKQHYCILKPVQSLTECLQKFQHIQPLLQNSNNLKRISYEVCEDAFQDGIKAIELRYSPGYIKGDNKNISFESIHQSILEGVKEAQKKYPIGVGLIGIVDRCSSLEEAEKQSEFILLNKGTFIGIDLANDEIQNPCAKFSHIFQKAKREGMGITVHSGETPGPDGAHRVYDAIELLCADRIGHGIHILEDHKIVKHAIQKGIHFEVSPTSNILSGCSKPDTHPITEMISNGLDVSINTDDPGLFLQSLSDEYALCVSKFSLTKEQIKQVNRSALNASFLSQSILGSVFPEQL